MMQDCEDSLTIINETVTHADNHDQMMAIIKSKLIDRARDAFPTDNTIQSLINNLRERIKGKTIEQVRASLYNVDANKKKKYLEDLNTDLGSSTETSQRLATADLKEQIKNLKHLCPNNFAIGIAL